MADREKMVQGLVAMAAADGRIGKREKKVVEILADRWGVDRSVVDAAIDEARMGKGRLSVPSEPSMRRELLKALISVAAVDGVIEPGERTMLEAFADKAGTSRFELDQMLEATLQKRAKKTGSSSGSSPPPPPSTPAAAAASAQTVAVPPPVPSEARPQVTSGQQAVPITIGTTDVYGEPPFQGASRGARLCRFCAEVVPSELKTCPFCETKVGGGAAEGLLADVRVKIGVLVGALIVFLVGPYLYGKSVGKDMESDGKVTLEMLGKPTPTQIRQAVKSYAKKANAAASQVRRLERQRDVAKKKLARYENLPNALRYARLHPKEQAKALEKRQAEFQAAFGGK